MSHDLHQPFAGQATQRLAQGRSADAQGLAEFALDQTFARGETALDDGVAQPDLGMLANGGSVDAVEARKGHGDTSLLIV